jgi:hypothetical protein
MAVGVLLVVTVLMPRTADADGAWLDAPPPAWNQPGMVIPLAPGTPLINPQSSGQANTPVSQPEQAVAAAGWTLFGTRIAGTPIEIVSGLAGYDGMCRPIQYQVFVFVGGMFAGTLSPVLMDSRSDGALVGTTQRPGDVIEGSYVRYTSSDPLCCPSATSTATFRIDRSGTAPVVLLQGVRTEATGAQTQPSPQPSPAPALPTATPARPPAQAPAQVPRSR